MRRRQTWAWAAALVLLLVAAWWLWPESKTTDVSPPAASKPTRIATVAPRASEDEPGPHAPASPDQGVDAGPRRHVQLLVVNAEGGMPLAGATVWLEVPGRSFHQRATFVAGARTNVLGVAELEIPESAVGLGVQVALDNFKSVADDFVDGQTIELEAVPPVRGRVKSEAGDPVSGAQVSSPADGKVQTLTGSDGRFELLVPHGDSLVGEKDGAIGVARSLGNHRDEVTIVLTRKEVRVSVVGRAGQPIDGVAVDLAMGAIRRQLRTGSDGTVTVPRVEGVEWEGTFSRSGYATVAQRLGRRDLYPQVVLTRPERLEGTLVNPDGSPVAEASVMLSNLLGTGAVQPDPVATGPDGRFAFDGLDAVEAMVRAQLQDRSTEVKVELADGQTTVLKLVLPPVLAEVELEVVDSKGRAVTDFDAVATPVPAQGWESRSSFGTVIELTKGRFHIAVTTDDGPKGSLDVDVDPKPDLPPLKIVLNGEVPDRFEQPPAQTLKVRVQTPNGAPVGQALVTCLDAEGETQSDGTFECEVHPTEDTWPIQVRAVKDQSSGMTRATGREAEVEVVLQPSRTIRGKILGAMPDAPCFLTLNSSLEMTEFPLSGPEFVLENRSAVRAFLCVAVRLSAAGDDGPTLGCAVTEGPGEVTIPIGPPGAVTLTVLDETGAPVEKPILYLDRHSIDPPAPHGAVQLTVSPGTHVLVVNVARRRVRAEVPFAVRSGETTALGVVRVQ